MALSDVGVMPATTEKQLVQTLLVNGDANQILLHDGTQREIPRSKDEDAQTENYSGNKGRHTLKNAIISTSLCLVLFVNASLSGATHDKKWLTNVMQMPLKPLVMSLPYGRILAIKGSHRRM